MDNGVGVVVLEVGEEVVCMGESESERMGDWFGDVGDGVDGEDALLEDPEHVGDEEDVVLPDVEPSEESEVAFQSTLVVLEDGLMGHLEVLTNHLARRLFTHSPTILMQDSIHPVRNYDPEGSIGAGSFGSVYLVRQTLSQQQFALKKITLKKKIKNREVEILKTVCSPFVVGLYDWFFTEEQNDSKLKLSLNLVMEYLPKNLLRVLRLNMLSNSFLPSQDVLRYTYCLLRALADLSTKNICHRDIKPENILISEQGDAKLCDFGSAKILVPGETNLSYSCSRPYRPPEMILGATDYTCQVDIWSLGCVLAEMLTNRCLFSGEDNTAMLTNIIKIIGAPDPSEVDAMGVSQLAIVTMTGIGLQTIIRKTNPKAEEGLLKLLSKMLVYNPQKRVTALQALSWSMFQVFK